jgi:serine/threonine protein kinase
MTRDLAFKLWIEEASDRFESEFQQHDKWPDLDEFVATFPTPIRAHDSTFDENPKADDKVTQAGDPRKILLVELLKIRLSASEDTVTNESKQLVNRYPHHRTLIETIVGAMAVEPSPDNLAASGVSFAVNQIQSVSTGQANSHLQPNQAIDDFVLVRHLGTGGMGTVWAARQIRPVKRDVAIKFMRQKLIGAQAQLRFLAEQQALAILNHAGIAKILAAGETESHQPYYVMELVSGKPITHFADDRQLDLGERLTLFLMVCDAVNHAHQKGIIHRDLKPKNVLVSGTDAHSHPKIIDYGLAKATTQSLTEESLNTVHGQILGTPEYMSPEQTRLDNRDIDTRTDIYALGALLYELLTGSSPLSNHHLPDKTLEESLAIIRDKDPLPPSQRSQSQTPRVTVPKELDWIVLKCLEKDRQRRYESAYDLAKDLNRFLDGEPVDAAPPSKVYRFSKFYNKYRTGVLATAISFAFLIAGLTGTGIALSWAITAQNESEQKAQELSVAVEDLKASKLAISRRSKELLELTAFQQKQIERIDPGQAAITLRKELIKSFHDAVLRDDETNSSVRPDELVSQFEQDLGKVNFVDLSLANLRTSVFEPALATIRNDYSNQPLLMARLLATTAESLVKVGLPGMAETAQQEAVKNFRAQLPSSDPELIKNLYRLEQIFANNSKFNESNVLIGEAEKLAKQHLDAKHPTSLLIEARIAEKAAWSDRNFQEAIPAFQKIIAASIEVHGETNPITTEFKTNFAAMLRLARRYHEAAPLFEEIIRAQRMSLADDPVPLIRSLAYLSNTIANFEPSIPNDQAWKLKKEAFELAEESLGQFHPVTITALHDLGAQEGYYHDRRNGEKLLLDAAERCRTVFGEVNDQLLGVNMSLVGVYWMAERNVEAIDLLNSQIRKFTRLHGSDYPDVHLCRVFLARSYHHVGKTDQAIEQIMLAKNIWQGSTATRSAQEPVMKILIDAQENELAIEVARQHIQTVQKTSYTLPIDRCVDLTIGWKWLLDLKQFAEAEPLIRESLKIRQKQHPNQWQTIETELLLGLCLQSQDKLTESEQTITSAHQKLVNLFAGYSTEQRKRIFQVYVGFELTELALPLAIAEVESARNEFPAGSMDRLKAMSVGWAWMMQLKQFSVAEPAIKECLEIHKQLLPEHWKTYDYYSQYGECLTEQGKAEQALPFLMQGHQGLLSRKHSIPASMMGKLGYALDRIVTCHQKLGDSDEAERWQEKLDTFNQTVR